MTRRFPTDVSPTDLADRVLAAPARLGRTRLALVDGPAGSGKTTLAGKLADALPSTTTVLHIDDVYRGWDTDFDEVHKRLREQVVDPLLAQRPGRYQRYDWLAERFADWIDVPVPDVLVLEGVGSGARRMNGVRSLLIWIEVPLEVRVRRGVQRDGDAVLPLWRAWMAHEEIEHTRQQTRERADLRLLGA